MRIIVIDPDRRVVSERDCIPRDEIYRQILGGDCSPHWVAEQYLPYEQGLVYDLGLVRKKKLWYFKHVHVWGPMIILGRDNRPAVSSVESIQGIVRW